MPKVELIIIILHIIMKSASTSTFIIPLWWYMWYIRMPMTNSANSTDSTDTTHHIVIVHDCIEPMVNKVWVDSANFRPI